MSKKSIRSFLILTAVLAVVMGSICAMVSGTGNAVPFIVCWLIVAAAIGFGWIIGVVMGEGEAKDKWRDRCLQRLETWRIRDTQVFTKEASAWNSAINRAMAEIRKEFRDVP